MKKKAFTLTELLVVVVIIGVLSAVVLPKFHQVIENRKITEAEGIMTAVRSEQQARCLLDKGYTTETSQLASYPKKTGKNYNYSLTTYGIAAQEKNQKYTLRMKAYGDGGICCEGAGCDNLNKDYPACSDYNVEQTECGSDILSAEQNPDPGPVTSCDLYNHEENCADAQGWGSAYKGTIYYTVNADCSGYDITSQCELISCDDNDKPDEEEECSCGVRTRTVECVKGEWKTGDWDRECAEEPDPETKDCAADDPKKTGTLTRRAVCDANTGTWSFDNVEWEGTCEDKDPTEMTCADLMKKYSYNSLDAYCEGGGFVSGNYSNYNTVVVKYTEDRQNFVFDYSDDCCIASQYEPATSKLLIVDYSGYNNKKFYYTTSGNNRALVYDYGTSSSFSGYENTFDDCSWGPSAFSDLHEVTGLDYAQLETGKAYTDCRACDRGKCPNPRVGSHPTVWAQAGRVSYREVSSDGKETNPCLNYDGPGDLGLHQLYPTCTTSLTSNGQSTLDNLNASQCESGRKNAGGGWMVDKVDSAKVEFHNQICGAGGVGHDYDREPTCTRDVTIMFRPRIVMYDYHYCKKK